jgi:hypothetical protein
MARKSTIKNVEISSLTPVKETQSRNPDFFRTRTIKNHKNSILTPVKTSSVDSGTTTIKFEN